MKYSRFLLVLAAFALAGCSEFPGVLTIKANPSGSVTIGATIAPEK